MTSTRWQRLTRPPRRLWVACSTCGYSHLNETNRLRRDKWEESSVGRHRQYRCGSCAAAETPEGDTR